MTPRARARRAAFPCPDPDGSSSSPSDHAWASEEIAALLDERRFGVMRTLRTRPGFLIVVLVIAFWIGVAAYLVSCAAQLPHMFPSP